MFESKKHSQNQEEGLKKLAAVSDNFQLGIVTSLLKEHDIPFMLKDYGSGDCMRLYTGSSIFGSDIFVAEEDFEKADALLDGINFEREEESGSD